MPTGRVKRAPLSAVGTRHCSAWRGEVAEEKPEDTVTKATCRPHHEEPQAP